MKTIQLLSNLIRSLDKCKGAGSEHLQRLFINNLLGNDVILTLKSLFILAKYPRGELEAWYSREMEELYSLLYTMCAKHQKKRIDEMGIIKRIPCKKEGNEDGESLSPKHLARFESMLIVGGMDDSFFFLKSFTFNLY